MELCEQPADKSLSVNEIWNVKKMAMIQSKTKRPLFIAFVQRLLRTEKHSNSIAAQRRKKKPQLIRNY